MASLSPINIKIMNVDNFVKENHCGQVSTVFIKVTSSNEFHPQGLFSEQIFGQIGSTDRLIRFGYIDLRTKVLHPIIYNNLLQLKGLYGEIMGRTTYAIFDKQLHDFVKSSIDDENADTGYEFFLSHLNEIQLVKNNSLTHNEKIDVINKYKDSWFLTKCLVMPAGIRDMNVEDGKPDKDSINKLYSSLINYSLAMPPTGSTSDIYDGVRFSIQKKVCEIYGYIFDMIEGKYGFFQRKYGSRNLALGTRNVISTANMSAKSPNDPQYLKMDELKIGIFQAAKSMMPVIIYMFRSMFIDTVLNVNNDNALLIDPKTLESKYQPISEDEKSKLTSSEGIEKIVDLFRNEEMRFKPFSIYNEEGKQFYVWLVYDNTDIVLVGKDVKLFKEYCQNNGIFYNANNVRPITYAEILYMCVYICSIKRHCYVTRYPAIEIGSCVPCKLHICSTNPGRTVRFISSTVNSFNEQDAITAPEYPIINGTFIDSTILHPQILKGLNADFDGDTVSVGTFLSDEANAEIGEYLNSKRRYIQPNGDLYMSSTDLIDLTMFNLSREPPSI